MITKVAHDYNRTTRKLIKSLNSKDTTHAKKAFQDSYVNDDVVYDTLQDNASEAPKLLTLIDELSKK